MYSIVLFIVETSFSGFLGSGERPTSAVDRHRGTLVVRDAPGEVDVVVPGPSSSRSATSSSKQSPPPMKVKADVGRGPVVAR